MERIEDIANTMICEGQGILAADESNNTIKKRFDSINIECNEENRRNYREMLFSAREAIKKYISGVILFEETLTQSTNDGTKFVDLIKEAGAVPGVKVDRGIKPLPGYPGEYITEGLDNLEKRLKTYYEMDARFAKWRAVINVSDKLPGQYSIKANTHALARYAVLCQKVGMVPIVEPEIQMDSKDAVHTIERCAEVTSQVLQTLFNELYEAKICFEGMILKPNMIIPANNCPVQVSVEEVAQETIRVLKYHVPSAVPAIAFLSGGQSDILATAHLSAMNAMYDVPWKLTFSYGRALQQKALKTWKGKKANTTTAQAEFSHRAKMNSLASLGKWKANMEKTDIN